MQKLYCLLFALVLFALSSQLLAQEVPVDLVTGAPSVTIPLYTAVNGDVSAPVGLSYSANGMKVSKYQQTGNAGLGWNLYAGGSIVREVRGLPDDHAGSSTDSRKGWYYSTLPSDLKNFTPANSGACTDEGTNFSKLDQWFSGMADTEPDVFYFQCGNYSGKFMLDNNKQWQVIPYQDVKVSYDWTTKYFTLTTGDGMTYKFRSKATTTQQAILQSGFSSVNYFAAEYRQYNTQLSYASAWNLTEAESLSGKKITYGYSSSDYATEEIPVRIAEYGSTPLIKSEYKVKYTTNFYRLISIKADQTEIVFNWGTKYINQVKVYNYANKVNPFLKEFNFGYNGAGKNGAAYLTKLVEQSANCVIMPPYVFDYYGVELTSTGGAFSLLPIDGESFKKDYWGYFNENTTSEIPTLYVYNNRNDGERFRIEPIPGEAPSSTLGVSGNTRRTNVKTVDAGMLYKMTYPSGGHNRFVYEANDYFDAAANTTFAGGGARVKKVFIHDGQNFKNDIIKELDYKSTNGHSSGRLLYPPVFAITTSSKIVASLDDMAPEKGLLYGRVGVRTSGTGMVVYESELPAVYPASPDQVTKSWYARESTLNSQGSLVCPSLGNIKAGSYTYPYPINGDHSYQRGQIKKVSYYDEADLAAIAPLPVKEVEYTYVNLTHGSPNAIQGLKYENVGGIYVYGLYTIAARNSKVLSQETNRIASQSDKTKKITSTTTYTYNGAGDNRLLSQTQTADSEGRIRRSSVKYSGDYFSSFTNTSPVKPMDVALKTMKDRAIANIPIESTASVVSGTTEKVVSAALTLFQPLLTTTYIAPLATYQLGRGTFNASSISNGSFTYDEQDYELTSKLSFDSNFKNVVNAEDSRGNVTAYHYGYEKTVPVAEIANARAEQVVYEGFETGGNTGYSFGITGTADGWTGEKSLSATANTIYSKTGIKYSGAIAYRFRCRIKSATTGNIAVEIWQNGARVSSVPLNPDTYTGDNNWNLVVLNVSAATLGNADFELRVAVSTSALIDDIAFFPVSALVNTYTYLPGIGKTSATDARGTTIFYHYDHLGRLTHTYDQNKDIRERKTYSIATVPTPVVSANFSYPSSGPINAGTAVTFSSHNSSCLSDLAYKWYISGVEVTGATTKDLTYTFPSAGQYVVKHAVTYKGETNIYQKDIKVDGPLLSVRIEITTGESYTCGPGANILRTLTAYVSGCNTGLSYRWEKSSDEKNWTIVGTDASTYSAYGTSTSTYYRCTIVAQGCGGPSYVISNTKALKHDSYCSN